jgi:ComF family protein
MLTLLGNLFGELLAPSRCAACDAPVPPRAPFCDACVCSLLPDTRSSARGTDVAAFEYGGAIARAIVRFKYAREPALARPLGALACTALSRLRVDVDCVTHVPLHAARLVDRGFDQAALLGVSVARALGVPMLYGALRRHRDTRQQASLGRAERLVNVSGAFEASVADVRGLRVLLVDDVRTTGATLAACATALREGGALETATLVVARDV